MKKHKLYKLAGITIGIGKIMKVIAIDLDGCAATFPEKVNILFENPDNFIVIYTARSESIRKITEEQLASLGIKYHSLVMQKLRADIYVDDRNEGGLKWPQ
jgi:hypothetical protein